MSYELNDKIKNLVPYEPNCGKYNIRLDANECTFGYDNELLNMVNAAINSVEFNRYPDPVCKTLRKSFADFYGIDYKNVTVGNGSDELISILQSAFMKKGDKLLVCTPDFSMYEFYSSISENPCVKYHKDESLNIDVDMLIKKANDEKASMILFSNPCNPTGQGLPKCDAVRLLNSVDSLVILDEAYMDFWDDKNSLIKDVNCYDNLVVLRTASKAVGSAALRLGFAVANKTISRAISAVKSPYNVNSISQAIGTRIYEKREYLLNRTKYIVENTKVLYNELLKISAETDDFKPYPTKTNFVFIKTSFGKELWEYLKSQSIIIRYMGEYLRITTGTAEEIAATISAIKKFISER